MSEGGREGGGREGGKEEEVHVINREDKKYSDAKVDGF